MTDITERFSRGEVDTPVIDRFPELSGFKTIVRGDGTHLLGAGLLADGLIVPLFPDEQAAAEIVKSLGDDPRDLELRVSALGDPFKAMREAAGEGAAGFQFSPRLFTDEQRDRLFKQTAGRVLFPFMTRREEAGGQWPTVLGSGLRCDAGVYLTRRGQTRFGPHDLRQWVRWDVMDRASAKLALGQPLRSHDPGEPFWCLSHAPGDVHFMKEGQRFEIGVPAVVLFADDIALRQFMPREGYYPVFTSKEGATEFLTNRLGGAFHIMWLAESSPSPNLIYATDFKAQELGPGGALIAMPVRIDDLPRHLKEVREAFNNLPPYASFVLNPAGHREDVAWGRFADVDDGLLLKSVGGRWKLLPDHSYSKQERIDQFAAEDTFFIGPSDFRFAEVRRSLGRFTPVLGEEDLRGMTATEAEEVICDFVVRGAGDPLGNRDVMGSPIQLDIDAETKAYAPFLGRWVLNFWDTVEGERLGPSYFDGPFEVARALCYLEMEDRPARVAGKYGQWSIGFDGSGNQDLEDAGGASLAIALVRICQRMVERGYRPSDALDMAASANSTLKSFRVSLCSNVADALLWHIPDDIGSDDEGDVGNVENELSRDVPRPSRRLMHEMGIPEEQRKPLIELIKADVDPEGDELLGRRVGVEVAVHLPAKTRLFLATALLQFDGMGKSPCIDYAPVSVQVVKALEFEMRELASALVRGYSPPATQSSSREEETLFNILANRREMVSLGSITHAFKTMRKAQGGILRHAANQLSNLGMLDLVEPRTVRLILNDVLNRFRNGGAHEQAISYATCQECIDILVGSRAQPGLILQVSRWRQQQAT